MKLISLFAAVMVSAAFAPSTSHAQNSARNLMAVCNQMAEYAEGMQKLRQEYPHFTKKIAKDVVKGETPDRGQREMAYATVDRVFAFPRAAHPAIVSNEIGRRCAQGADEVLPK